MLRRLLRWLRPKADYSLVQFPTREPRPKLHFDGPSRKELLTAVSARATVVELQRHRRVK